MATFGKTTSGAANTLHNSNRKTLSQAVLTETATLTSMTVRARTSNTTEAKLWKGVIYADNAGAPGALLFTTAEGSISNTVVDSYTANFAGQSLAAGTYWIGYIYNANATTNLIIYRDNTASSALSAVDTYSDGASDPAGTLAALNGPIDAFVTYSTAAATTVPNAPSGLTATASGTTVTLGWTDNGPSGANNETSFRIERDGVEIASVGPDVTTYVDNSLSPTTTYVFRVRARNSVGDSAYSSTASATTGSVSRWSSYIQAWIYPGPPAENADEEYNDGRVIHTLKPEYYRIGSTGVLEQVTVANSGQNGYTPANAASVKSKSTEQYVTVAGATATMTALLGDSTKRTNAINTLVNFVNDIGFTGVDLDWEGYGGWSSTLYGQYKTFLTDLKTALNASGKKLMICAPPIGTTTEQSYYQFKYEEVVPLVDWFTIMSYDYHYDYGGGAAVAPTAWVTAIANWYQTKIGNKTKLIMGMNSYGYSAATGSYDITILTYDQAATKPGFSTTATLDTASNERYWNNGGIHYRFVDIAGVNAKRAALEALGVTRISVWHLGGNKWFTGKLEPEVAPGTGGGGESGSGGGTPGTPGQDTTQLVKGIYRWSSSANAWVEAERYSSGGTSYSDEQAQDAVATALTDTPTVDWNYNDTANSITADVLDSPTVGGNTPANLRDRSTHTGTQSADTITDGTTNKAYTATEKTKLAGIATGATANDTDANLKNRANHTGTQAPSTIEGTAGQRVVGKLSGTVYGELQAIAGNTAGTIPYRRATGDQTFDVVTPTNADNVANKAYVDTGLAGKVSTTGNETIAGTKTFTNNPIVQAGYAQTVAINTTSAQYAGAGYQMYSNAATLTGAAGVQFYAGIANTGITQTYYSIDILDRQGNYLSSLVNWDLQSKLMTAFGAIAMAGFKITGLGEPTAAQDAATKNYVDTNFTDLSTDQTWADGKDIAVGTTNGTKIGTATTQKLGFFNATPVVQPAANVDLGTVLSNLGLRTAGTAYPITTSNAVVFSGARRDTPANITASTTLTAGTSAFMQRVTAAGTAIDITLPSTTTAGHRYRFFRTDNTATVVRLLGTINGATNYTVGAPYKYVEVVSTTTSGSWEIWSNN